MYDKPLSCFWSLWHWMVLEEIKFEGAMLVTGFSWDSPFHHYGIMPQPFAVRNYADFSYHFCPLMLVFDILFPFVLKNRTGAGFNLLDRRRGCSTRCFLLAVAAGVKFLHEKDRISATNW
ncbi:hypothetical protein DVH24_015386 [Malus domestica]|uniref:Uncharacterized protein n=1 Tax=Malus domestica TaxID=3750 RepID=A0A498K3P8_MALDO|nr:hypothetical protein DVH24_015386 [Malus domestica]